MNDVNFFAALRYAEGHDPLDVATDQVEMLVMVRDELLNVRERENGLPRLPAWQDLTNASLARKIVGWLLDAGWTPPGGDPR